MEKHLLPQVPKYFKASLHTHSTVSDGKLTPEQVRDLYRALGFSILALTDHSVIVEHQDLNTDDLIMITGVEIDMDDRRDPAGDTRGRNRHLCLLAKTPYQNWIPYRDTEPKPSSIAYEQYCEMGGMSNEYSAENCNAVIAECNRRGYLVTYNHPCWSLESYPEYAPLKGLWAMEYRNTGSIELGYDENNGRIYQDLQMLGNRLMPVCADDMHKLSKAGKSWTMVGAEKLEYGAVMEALEKGDLYSSCGPQIKSLTWDGQTLRVTCSACTCIQVVTQARVAHYAKGQALTKVEFDMTKWLKKSEGKELAFFRLILTAADGTYAVTRAYHLDELK